MRGLGGKSLHGHVVSLGDIPGKCRAWKNFLNAIYPVGKIVRLRVQSDGHLAHCLIHCRDNPAAVDQTVDLAVGRFSTGLLRQVKGRKEMSPIAHSYRILPPEGSFLFFFKVM